LNNLGNIPEISVPGKTPALLMRIGAFPYRGCSGYWEYNSKKTGCLKKGGSDGAMEAGYPHAGTRSARHAGIGIMKSPLIYPTAKQRSTQTS
jgi:hypothetical protein